jgi:hypothetical protein
MSERDLFTAAHEQNDDDVAGLVVAGAGAAVAAVAADAHGMPAKG